VASHQSVTRHHRTPISRRLSYSAVNPVGRGGGGGGGETLRASVRDNVYGFVRQGFRNATLNEVSPYRSRHRRSIPGLNLP